MNINCPKPFNILLSLQFSKSDNKCIMGRGCRLPGPGWGRGQFTFPAGLKDWGPRPQQLQRSPPARLGWPSQTSVTRAVRHPSVPRAVRHPSVPWLQRADQSTPRPRTDQDPIRRHIRAWQLAAFDSSWVLRKKTQSWFAQCSSHPELLYHEGKQKDFSSGYRDSMFVWF